MTVLVRHVWFKYHVAVMSCVFTTCAHLQCESMRNVTSTVLGEEVRREGRIAQSNVLLNFQLEAANQRIEELKQQMRDDRQKMRKYHAVFYAKEKFRALLKVSSLRLIGKMYGTMCKCKCT